MEGEREGGNNAKTRDPGRVNFSRLVSGKDEAAESSSEWRMVTIRSRNINLSRLSLDRRCDLRLLIFVMREE
jgi:hypothetical protein